MDRRSLLSGSVLAGASAIASPAVAQSSPEISWRLTSSFPKSLDTIYYSAEILSKAVAEVTDNRFKIQVFAGGEVVPGLAAFDAAQAGTIEMCHTFGNYYIGKDPTFAFGGGMPFGLNTRQQNAFLYYGPGLKLLEDFYTSQSVVGLSGGNTGVQMGGFFRKEINTVADLSGLKMRVAGLGGMVLAKLGLVPQQISGGDLYAALERGTIDAAEWIGPYDDERLGLQRVAKYYYTPGWYDGGANIQFFINKAKFDALPDHYRAALRLAAHRSNEWMTAKYDSENPGALKKLISQGVQLKAFPRDVMEACFRASEELCTELAAKNQAFKTIYEPWLAFRADTAQWFRFSELTYDAFLISKPLRKS